MKEMPVKLANGHKAVVRNQTRTLQVAIGTPWGPVGFFSFFFAVIPVPWWDVVAECSRDDKKHAGWWQRGY